MSGAGRLIANEAPKMKTPQDILERQSSKAKKQPSKNMGK
jgi:hypothetical protein